MEIVRRIRTRHDLQVAVFELLLVGHALIDVAVVIRIQQEPLQST